jgi:uncharacterized protein
MTRWTFFLKAVLTNVAPLLAAVIAVQTARADQTELIGHLPDVRATSQRLDASFKGSRPEPAQAGLWNRQAFQAYEANQLVRASRLYRKAALAGDWNARYNLASMVMRGESQSVSHRQAIRWIAHSAHHGLAPAQFSYGLLLELGEDVSKDLVAANLWYEKAARQGHAEAALAVATGYFLGRGSTQNYSLAAYWYDKAAQAGESAAQYSLAMMYLTGLGISSDREKALEWFTMSARQGDLAAKAQAKWLNEQRAND